MISRTTDEHSHTASADADLLEQARQGNAGAFRELVERYRDVVAGTVQRMLGHGPDADDVGQETFIRFYRSLNDFRGDSALGTYLTRIAMNLSLNALKRRRRWYERFVSSEGEDRESPPPELTLSGDAEIDRREQEERVRKGVEALDPRHKAVVVLRMMEGYSTKETAEILGVAEGTVLSRLSRGMKKLESLIGEG